MKSDLHSRVLQFAAFLPVLLVATNPRLRALLAVPAGCLVSALNLPVSLTAAAKTIELLEHLKTTGELAAPSADHWGRLMKAVQVRLNAGYDLGPADVDFLVGSGPRPTKDGPASLPGHRRLVQGLRRFLVPTAQTADSQPGSPYVPTPVPVVVTQAASEQLSPESGLVDLVDLADLPDTSADDVSQMADLSKFDYAEAEDWGEPEPCLARTPVAAGDQPPVSADIIIFDDENVFPSGKPEAELPEPQPFPTYLVRANAGAFDPEL